MTREHELPQPGGHKDGEHRTPHQVRSVWQIPLIVPDIAARLGPLHNRPGGVDEAQLDARLGSIATDYATAHPGYVLRAAANDTLRLFDLGPGHRLQSSIIDRELALPGLLRRTVSVSGQVLCVLALLGLAIGLRRRRGLAVVAVGDPRDRPTGDGRHGRRYP